MADQIVGQFSSVDIPALEKPFLATESHELWLLKEIINTSFLVPQETYTVLLRTPSN